MNCIVVAGMPASGKTTLAKKLGNHFGLPVLEKDEFKEKLFDTVGFRCYAEKRQLDVAANAVLLCGVESLLRAGKSVIVVNNFRTEMQPQLQALLDRYSCKVAVIFVGGDSDVFYQRYVERDRLHLRHLGHVLQDQYPPAEGSSLDYEMTRQEFAEKFEQLGMDKLELKGMRIDLDGTQPETIPVQALIAQLAENFCKNGEGAI